MGGSPFSLLVLFYPCRDNAEVSRSSGSTAVVWEIGLRNIGQITCKRREKCQFLVSSLACEEIVNPLLCTLKMVKGFQLLSHNAVSDGFGAQLGWSNWPESCPRWLESSFHRRLLGSSLFSIGNAFGEAGIKMWLYIVEVAIDL